MILVTGATGKVGGQVVAQLREMGVEVRGLTRRPEREWEVYGDLGDPATLDAALEGVDRVFLVWPTLRADAHAEAVLKKITDRVRRVVYLSSAGAVDGADPVNSSHRMIEGLLRDSGVEWTFVRGGGFAGNDLGWAAGIRADGVVREAFGGWARSVVHEADLAAVGVRALLDDAHVGAAYAVTGPRVHTQQERVRIIGEVIGRPLRFEEVPAEEAKAGFAAWLPPEAVDATFTEMLTMTAEAEPVSTAVEELTGRPARTYREWVLDHRDDFAPPVVEMTLDIACSWSYLGFNRLRKALERYRAEGGRAEVVFRPYQLAPEVTTPEPLTRVHERAFGPEAAAATEQMTGLGAAEGIAYRFDRALFANTFEAHRLIALASAQGRGEAMTERLFRAYFGEGRDVSDRATLRELAAETGVTWSDEGADELRAELAKVRVSGVPVFAARGRTLSGAQGEDTLYDLVTGQSR
ncbi:DsbA family protein [Nonomuraea typhae]|uniref:DsbA family protein n=1 Tax=Nonomuraea typhae TaxID=2603600 RepID=UPI0012FB336B|nr:DsbA family protein [Nonomuraea typhae]